VELAAVLKLRLAYFGQYRDSVALTSDRVTSAPGPTFAALGGPMKFTCEGLGAIEAANIRHAARIFANRVAHERYGPKGRCRILRLQNHNGPIVRALKHSSAFLRFSVMRLGESYRFTVIVSHDPPPQTLADATPASSVPDER
jgi:hypothetical protein